MQWKTIGFAAAFAVAGNCPAFAALLHCAVDDAAIKMVLESSRNDPQVQRFPQLRGIIVLKDAAAPPVLRTVRLATGMLTLSALNDQLLRMRVYEERQAWRSFGALELKMEAGPTSADADRLAGRYKLSIEWSASRGDPDRQSAQYGGDLTCKYE